MSTQRLASIVALLIAVALTADAQNPRAARDFYNRGRERYEKHDFDGAIADFTKAIEHSTRPARRDIDRRPDQGIGSDFSPNSGGEAASGKPVALIDPLTAAAYANRALAHYGKGDLEPALADCDLAIGMQPGLIEAYNNRGAIRWAKGDIDGAIADFDRVISARPAEAPSYNNRASARVDKGDLAGALADFDRAITLDPRRAEIYFNRGLVRLRLGQTVEAEKDFAQCVKLDPAMKPQLEAAKARRPH